MLNGACVCYTCTMDFSQFWWWNKYNTIWRITWNNSNENKMNVCITYFLNLHYSKALIWFSAPFLMFILLIIEEGGQPKSSKSKSKHFCVTFIRKSYIESSVLLESKHCKIFTFGDLPRAIHKFEVVLIVLFIKIQ